MSEKEFELKELKMPLFFLILLPILEIYLFVEIGEQIGGGATVLLILGTAILGITLIRQQGFATLAQAQADMARGIPPVKAMGHGLLILLAGGLLVVPGFLTDSIGALLLLPPVRAFIGTSVISALVPIDLFKNDLFKNMPGTHFHQETRQETRQESHQQKTAQTFRKTFEQKTAHDKTAKPHAASNKSSREPSRGPIIDADFEVSQDSDNSKK